MPIANPALYERVEVMIDLFLSWPAGNQFLKLKSKLHCHGEVMICYRFKLFQMGQCQLTLFSTPGILFGSSPRFRGELAYPEKAFRPKYEG